LVSLVDRVGDLDREAIRRSAIDRFSADRMTEAYEALMLRLVSGEATGQSRNGGPQLRVAASRTLARAGLAGPVADGLSLDGARLAAAAAQPGAVPEAADGEERSHDLGWEPDEGSTARLP
jgi:hypothetical protein